MFCPLLCPEHARDIFRYPLKCLEHVPMFHIVPCFRHKLDIFNVLKWTGNTGGHNKCPEKGILFEQNKSTLISLNVPILQSYTGGHNI